MLQLFRQISLCVATVKLLQSLRLFEIFLSNYCSAGVIELYPILKLSENTPFLIALPNYTLSEYITALVPISIRYRTIPYLKTLPNNNQF